MKNIKVNPANAIWDRKQQESNIDKPIISQDDILNLKIELETEDILKVIGVEL